MVENFVPPNILLMRMVTAFRVSQALYVMASLDLAGLLKDGPRDIEELARATGAFQPALARFLPALVSLGILTQDEQVRFGLTPMGEYFRSDHPQSVRSYTLYMAGETSWQSWGKLEHSVLTGESAFNRVFGTGLFDYFSQHPEAGQIFDKAMAGTTASLTRALLDAYDFSPFQRVVDVGGGNGSLLAAILIAYPALEGALFDLPQVTAQAAGLLAEAGVVERCEVVGGDFFKDMPPSGDVLLLKFILHDWDDSRAVAILKSCYRALSDNGRLLVVEQLQPDRVEVNEIHQTLITRDLNMLVLFGGGRERNKNEFRQLFEAAGFGLERVIPLAFGWNIIEATKLN